MITDVLFIKMVENFDCLWKSDSEVYEDPNKVEEAWRKIVELCLVAEPNDLCLSVLSVKERWKSLCRIYVSELEQMQLTGLTSLWRNFPRMDKFLQPYRDEVKQSCWAQSEDRTVSGCEEDKTQQSDFSETESSACLVEEMAAADTSLQELLVRLDTAGSGGDDADTETVKEECTTTSVSETACASLHSASPQCSGTSQEGNSAIINNNAALRQSPSSFSLSSKNSNIGTLPNHRGEKCLKKLSVSLRRVDSMSAREVQREVRRRAQADSTRSRGGAIPRRSGRTAVPRSGRKKSDDDAKSGGLREPAVTKPGVTKKSKSELDIETAKGLLRQNERTIRSLQQQLRAWQESEHEVFGKLIGQMVARIKNRKRREGLKLHIHDLVCEMMLEELEDT